MFSCLPVCPVAAVAGCLTPHALEGWPVPEAHTGPAVGLGDAGGQRPEHRHRPRVDLHVLDVDLGVEVELRAVKQERVCKETSLSSLSNIKSNVLGVRVEIQFVDRHGLLGWFDNRNWVTLMFVTCSMNIEHWTVSISELLQRLSPEITVSVSHDLLSWQLASDWSEQHPINPLIGRNDAINIIFWLVFKGI